MQRFRAALAIALAASLLWACPLVLWAQTLEAESRLKAAVVSKFPQFVGWPAQATSGRTRLDVCVAGPGGVRGDLEALVAGETLAGLPFVVRDVREPADAASCHLLYITGANGGRPDPLVRAVQSLPVLSVSDRPGFLDEGGIVALRMVRGRVRFDIDYAAAQRVGLRIDSQLLQLALSVRGGGPS